MKNMIKKLLPKPIFLKLVLLRDNLNYYATLIASKNIFLTFLSMVLDGNYINEHKAVLKGAAIYHKKVRNSISNIYFLRRNIHRIEKGLLMQPLKKEFGLRFIRETVENFITLNRDSHPDVFNWGTSILSEYFKLTASNDKNYKIAKTKFVDYIEIVEDICLDRTPYTFNINKSRINYEEFERMMITRKSVRWFIDKEVEQEKIKRALNIAKLSPASCNRQPYRYYVTTDPKKAQFLASISGGTGGWGNNLKAIAILVGSQSTFANSDSRHLIYIDSTLTVMPFILSLQTLGLASCIINWADIPFREKKMRNALNLRDDEKIVMSIAIGYSNLERKVAYSGRMPVDQVVEFI